MMLVWLAFGAGVLSGMVLMLVIVAFCRAAAQADLELERQYIADEWQRELWEVERHGKAT